ncbi:MAG: 30S ribosomal protein S20 [Parcubacteria group bacterium]
MAHTKQAEKSIRQTEKRTLRNKLAKDELKDLIKKCRKAIVAKDKNAALELIKQIVKKADKASQKGILKKNTAARKKSRVMIAYNKLNK